eukprot:comp5806_c0_seq1/m.1660 comp5806_c0_seq1/g.1660  ORF comp5806_c0_seq1/g.1660 comp5806_c0_seq1/m.1660 type:complete len:386 (-) comp5806_c0_seq1:110-1267(-)
MLSTGVRPTLLGRRFAVAVLSRNMHRAPEPYTPPEWAAHLPSPPTRIRMAQLPTPVHEWNLPGKPDGFNVYIKRDDLTGSALSGNKVRKLEFLMADALSKKCDTVITCGAVQSNHARATAVAARELGMSAHLMLRSDDPNNADIGSSGNILLDRMVGASIYLVPRVPYLTGLLPRMEYLASTLQEKGHRPYLIPVGGSNTVGLWGYFEGMREILEQGLSGKISDIVLSCGSGGTACGLALANHLVGSPFKVHAVSVCDNAAYFHGHVNETLQELGITNLKSEEILDVIDGYKGKGYGVSTDDELTLLRDIGRQTGIFLDPVYTVKGAKGLLTELNQNPRRFAGKNVMFIHTGGVFGLYDMRIEPFVSGSVVVSNFKVPSPKTERR